MTNEELSVIKSACCSLLIGRVLVVGRNDSLLTLKSEASLWSSKISFLVKEAPQIEL